MWVLLLLLLVNIHAERVMLKEGSIEKQTYGKDGLILFHYDYPDYWNSIIEDTRLNITFFEVNCNLYDVCQQWSDTIPHLVYSVDNSIWKAVKTDDIEDFIFRTFEKRCVFNRIKCKEHELRTIEMFEEEPVEVIEEAIDDLRANVVEIEATFADYYKQIQEEFEKKRVDVRKQLEQVEESINILQDLKDASL